jgi:hypothetical protein
MVRQQQQQQQDCVAPRIWGEVIVQVLAQRFAFLSLSVDKKEDYTCCAAAAAAAVIAAESCPNSVGAAFCRPIDKLKVTMCNQPWLASLLDHALPPTQVQIASLLCMVFCCSCCSTAKASTCGRWLC